MAVVKATIKAALIARLPAAADNTKQAAFADALASWIVSDILPAMAVAAGIPVATTGSATNQTGVTTAPGTVS